MRQRRGPKPCCKLTEHYALWLEPDGTKYQAIISGFYLLSGRLVLMGISCGSVAKALNSFIKFIKQLLVFSISLWSSLMSSTEAGSTCSIEPAEDSHIIEAVPSREEPAYGLVSNVDQACAVVWVLLLGFESNRRHCLLCYQLSGKDARQLHIWRFPFWCPVFTCLCDRTSAAQRKSIADLAESRKSLVEVQPSPFFQYYHV